MGAKLEERGMGQSGGKRVGWVGSGGMGGEERVGGRAGVRVCISIEIRGLSLSVTLVLIFFSLPHKSFQ